MCSIFFFSFQFFLGNKLTIIVFLYLPLCCLIYILFAKSHVLITGPLLFQDCGHDSFCFGCSHGLVECPVYKGPITMWGRMSTTKKNNPLLQSLGGELDVATDPLIGKPVTKKQAKELPVDNKGGITNPTVVTREALHWYIGARRKSSMREGLAPRRFKL
jgi:hypothetical protein